MNNYSQKEIQEYMLMALNEAVRGRGKVSPNPFVGAVIVKENKIIGKGFHCRCGDAHAEINAIANAGQSVSDCDMFVTLEPCNHQGRTGPCTDAIIKSGIKRVYIGMKDPNPLVSGQGIKKLEQNGILAEYPVLQEQCVQLNEQFVKYITTKKPFVILKGALTLDGKIASKTGDSNWVSCKDTLEMVHVMRTDFDAILVGIGTVLKDNPSLTARPSVGLRIDPVRIVIDRDLKTPEGAKVLGKESDKDCYLVISDKIPENKYNKYENKGFKIIRLTVLEDGYLDLNSLMSELGKMEISSLMVEGGGEINASFINSGLVDKFVCVIAPKIIGGKNAVSWVGGKGIEKMNDSIKLDIHSVKKCGTDLVITAYPEKNNF